MGCGSDQVFTAFVGIDWADTKHDICVQAAGSERRELSCIAHEAGQIESWACSLRERFGGHVAVALELTKGPIVYALQKYDFIVLFPINPATLARYRQAFKPSGAKDDPTDAERSIALIDKSPSLRRRSPIMHSSVHCPGQDRTWRLVCWSPSVSSASASPAPLSCNDTQALRRSRSAAARRAGCTGAGNAPPFFAKPLSNGPPRRSTSPFGRARFTDSTAIKVALIKPPSAHLPTNGYASCIAAGKRVLPTTK